MSLVFYGHPFSSYCQKVQVALYENALPFEYRVLDPARPDIGAEWAALWPLKKMPVLVDDGQRGDRVQHHHRTPPPASSRPRRPVAGRPAHSARRAVHGPVLRPPRDGCDAGAGVRGAARGRSKGNRTCGSRARTGGSYAWLEHRLGDGRRWASGDAFSMADCAAAPALFYADWVHRIGEAFPAVNAYRARLLARPSYARAVEEARPFRAWFPLGAPDRD